MTLLDFFRRIADSAHRNGITAEKLLKKYIGLYEESSGHYDTKLLGTIQKLRQNFAVACFTNTEPEIAELRLCFHLHRNGLAKAAAEKAGLKGIFYTDIQRLKRDLSKFSVNFR